MLDVSCLAALQRNSPPAGGGDSNARTTTLHYPTLCRLYNLGYRDISHSGYVCDERWYSITYGVRCVYCCRLLLQIVYCCLFLDAR